MTEVKIENLNNKLACQFFLHVAPPIIGKQHYHELVRTDFTCWNGLEKLHLKLREYQIRAVTDITSSITIVSAGMFAMDFWEWYCKEQGCGNMEPVALYYFEVIKRETL